MAIFGRCEIIHWLCVFSAATDSSRARVSFSNRHTVVEIMNERAGIKTPTPIKKLGHGHRLEMSDYSVDLTGNKKRVQIQVTGMNCASCVAKIERHLRRKRGGWCILQPLYPVTRSILRPASIR